MWGPPGGPDPASGGPSNEWTGPPIPGGPSNEWTAPPPAYGGPSNEWTGPGGPSNEWTAPPPASGGPSNEWTGPGGPSNEWTAPPPASGGPSNEWTGPPIPASGGSVYGGQPPYGFRPTAFPPAPSPRLEGYGPGPPPPHMAGHGYGFDPSVPPPSFNRPPPPALHGSPFPPMLNQAQRSVHGGPPCSDLRPPPLAGPPPPSSSGPWFEDVHNNNPGASTSSQRFHQQQRQAESCGFGPQGVQSLPSSDSLRQHAHRDVPERGGGGGGGGGPLLDSPAFPPAAAAWSRGDVQNQSFVKAPETQPPPDEDAVQRRQDEQWLRRFLQSRGRTFKMPASEEEEEEEEGEQPSRSSNEVSVPLMQSALYGAARLVSELSLACETLRRNLENEDESVWGDSYAAALRLKGELRDRMTVVNDDHGGRRLDALKSKLSRVAKKRAWQRRKKLRQREEKRLEEERVAEKEAEIDKWRLKKILEVEEKKRELELKLATDSVLGEVLKKQADVKRMLDILRSLEKLRKLRKEAASRKGIFPEPEADQVFDQQLEQLRALIRKRTAVYGAEENMLRVMLEGEQEEERKKDLERRQRKERERHLQKKRDMEAMLFGDEMPADHLLQPFREYYTQAEHSLPALVQIRREWDVFLVAVDHPDGTPIPQGWVLPEAPSDWAWASALEQ